MANPQVENGHIRLANQLDEAMTVADFNVPQSKIVRLLARLTYGWKRRTVRISQVDLAAKVGLAASSGGWRRAFTTLIDEGVIVEVEPPIGRQAGAYALNKNFERWGRYSVARAFLEAQFNERPDHVDNLPRAIARLRARSTETPQSELDFDPRTDLKGSENAQNDPDSLLDSLSQVGQSTDEKGARRLSQAGQSNSRRLSHLGAEAVPPGRLGSPTWDSQDRPNSLSDNENGGRKAIESNRQPVAGKKGTAAADAGSTVYESVLVDAALSAVRRRWPDKTLSTRHASDLVAEFSAAGIPPEFAADAIRSAIARKLGDCPGSIAWARSRVLDQWRDREHEVDKHGPTAVQAPRPKNWKPAELADLVQTVIDPTLGARREAYDLARREAAIAWGKDPANAEAYQAIVAAANSEFDDTIRTPLGRKARDVRVLERATEAVPFPPFDLYRPEPTSGGNPDPNSDPFGPDPFDSDPFES